MVKSKLAKQCLHSNKFKFEGSLYGGSLEPDLALSLCDLEQLAFSLRGLISLAFLRLATCCFPQPPDSGPGVSMKSH